MLEALIKSGILLGGLMTAAAYFVLLERRLCAWMQDRRGPNRVGLPLSLVSSKLKDLRLFGLGQPTVDGAKFILKEEYTPAHVDRRLYILAPIVILVAALAVFAVIPFGGTLPIGDRHINLVVAFEIDVAILFVFALSSIAVYGVILGGWASNNKYSFLGGLRSSAQLIAYELPLGLGLLGVVLAAGSMNLSTIMERQGESGWFVLAQPLGFTVFMIAAFAEAGRLPFDLPECEQELIGGYHTEYAGMKLLLFLVGEFLHMITAAFLIVILFLGGWHFPGLTGAAHNVEGWFQAIARIGVLNSKVCLVIVFFMLVRWSWPRFRFDQLMGLAWKIMLPLGLINLVVVAAVNQFMPENTAAAMAVSWVVCIAAWVGITVVGPLIADNRPHSDLVPYEIDSQI
ncbi:MAG: hydroxyacid dehydrogenase [Planctomycetaceae bacterium]|nr:hydroxyacid dehydrogenase [Planctomycetaceae bacterium]